MLNSLAAGRRLAARLLAAQLGVAVLAALAFLAQGYRAAVAAGLGALMVAAGNALLALRLFGPGGAGRALAGFLVGTVLKWAVVLGGLYLVLVRWRLPPAPAIAGLALALAVNLMALRFKG
ncbi:hypothetical protein MBSD_n0173 [Mizugakiibacter sediminis]|uniref:ATP synthase I chain n=1 Tax=Mizugakiibacter sediminis TaxID=1475481 RepID=A0A0K8QJL0_9GAMM|nr:ATP synthase subunit I [Mizugakiibacter sediminis]GAP64891.1 hypothetical protein MBSD_n0173 [Mizugakiibacter sediminis]